MRKKAAVISNLCIAVVLIGLGVAVFTTDLSNVFLTVSAPVYNGDRSGNKVSLMFTVEDDARHLPEVMQTLKDNNASATFFVGGKWASGNRSLVMDIARDFEIANHGYNNRDLTTLNEADQRREIGDCHAMVKAVTSGTPLDIEQGNEAVKGTDMKLFSPPMGAFNRGTLRCAERLGYRTVMWSKDATAGSVLYRATEGVLSGDIVLLRLSSATLGALPEILAEYTRLGFSAVKISDNII